MEPEDVTRRQWLLRLGGGTVLTGFSGLDLAAAAQPALPDGLYQPSIDHLAHVLKPATGSGTAHAPLFFTAAEYQQIGRLVGAMLGEDPATAPAPEIAAWIDLVVYDAAAVREAARSLSPAHRAVAHAFHGETPLHELETFDAKQVCRTGLARIGADPSRTLEAWEADGDPFIEWLKGRVIEGFYTSQAGLKELDYKGNSFYSISPGCDG